VLIPAEEISGNDGVADRAGAASLKTGTGPGDAPSCAVAVVTYVKPIQH
jgi:hypothetical protein